MTTQQKIVPVIVFGILFLALGYSILPFKFAGSVSCEAPLFGGDPKSERPVGGGFIRPREDCHSAAKSRMSVVAVTCLIAVLGGSIAVASRPFSQSCLSGDHEGCREWWPQVIGPLAQTFGCQCDCHTATAW